MPVSAVVESLMLKQMHDNGLNMWTCTECGHATKDKGDLRKHVEAKHIQNNGFTCIHCGKLYPSKNSLTSHVSRYHRNPNF